MRRARRLLIGIAGLAALAGAAWTRLIVARAERAFPATGEYVEANGARLRYVERGAGPPVVLVHGAFGGLEDWTATGILDELARDHRVLAFDRPGHGWSSSPRTDASSPIEQARSLRAALRALGVERPLVAGFSWGGAVAIAWAIEAPEEIAGLALVNPVAYPWPGATATPFVLSGIPLAGPLFAHTLAAPLGTWMTAGSARRAFEPAPVPASFARSPVPLALRPQTFLVETRDMRLLKAAVAIQSPRHGEIRAPLAILAGRGDRVTHWDFHSEPLSRAVAGAELRVLDDAGHQVLHSHPAEVVALVRRVAGRAAERTAGGAAGHTELAPPADGAPRGTR
jgi:pimeloyl-ACP methyl ester carboxylesterase